MTKKFFIPFIIISYIIYYILNIPTVTNKYSDTIDVTFSPIQTNIMGINSISKTINNTNYIIKPIANYRISAVALSKEQYFLDKNSDLSKYDLALGWGDVSEKKNIQDIRFSQGARWYHFSIKPSSVLDSSYISTHSSNNHIIHSNKNILKAIKSIKKGDNVVLEGYLVNVSSDTKKFTWNSSISRSDTGNGSCELIYVNKVIIKDKIYE